MPFTFKPRSAFTALAAGVAISWLPQAHALTTVQDLDFGFGPILVHDGAGLQLKAAEQTMSFQQFDPTLGTLTAARWELQSAFGAFALGTVTSVALHPDRPVSGGLTLGASLNTHVAGANGLRGTSGDHFSAGRSASGSCSTMAAAGPCSIALELGDQLDGVIHASLLDELIGNGSFMQGVQAVVALTHDLGNLPIPSVSIDSLAQLIWADSDDAGGIGRLRLVYEFEPLVSPVPEPASSTLMAFGMALLWVLRRRRPGRA